MRHRYKTKLARRAEVRLRKELKSGKRPAMSCTCLTMMGQACGHPALPFVILEKRKQVVRWCCRIHRRQTKIDLGLPLRAKHVFKPRRKRKLQRIEVPSFETAAEWRQHYDRLAGARSAAGDSGEQSPGLTVSSIDPGAIPTLWDVLRWLEPPAPQRRARFA